MFASGAILAKADTASWVAAVATTAAVVVALFGPTLRAWLSRPVLKLSASDEDHFYDAGGDPALDVAPLSLENRRGRQVAREVQVTLSVGAPFSGEEGEELSIPLSEQRNLRFELDAPDTTSGSTVPPGSCRRVQFVVMGPKLLIVAWLRDRGEDQPTQEAEVHGAFCAQPSAAVESALWLTDDSPLDICLVVSGANFDALTYVGQIVLKHVDMTGTLDVEQIERPHSLVLRWTKPLRQE